MAERKKSCIPSFFTLTEDTSFTKCYTCATLVCQGGKSPKIYTTTNLVNHLKFIIRKFLPSSKNKNRSNKSNKVKPLVKQLTLKEVNDRVNVWDINDARAQLLHRRLVETIALDTQPFSIFEDVGFIRLATALEPNLDIQYQVNITYCQKFYQKFNRMSYRVLEISYTWRCFVVFRLICGVLIVLLPLYSALQCTG